MEDKKYFLEDGTIDLDYCLSQVDRSPKAKPPYCAISFDHEYINGRVHYIPRYIYKCKNIEDAIHVTIKDSYASIITEEHYYYLKTFLKEYIKVVEVDYDPKTANWKTCDI